MEQTYILSKPPWRLSMLCVIPKPNSKAVLQKQNLQKGVDLYKNSEQDVKLVTQTYYNITQIRLDGLHVY